MKVGVSGERAHSAKIRSTECYADTSFDAKLPSQIKPWSQSQKPPGRVKSDVDGVEKELMEWSQNQTGE